MNKITSVNVFTKEGKTTVVFNNSIFLSANYVTKLTGMHSNFFLLVGSSIEAIYYNVDDVIAEGKVCTKADTIVNTASIVLSDRLAGYAMEAAMKSAA